MINPNKWDGEDWAGFLLLMAFLVAVSFGIRALTADHRTRGYYMGLSVHNVNCVYSDNPWDPDDIVYCTEDPQKALDYMKRANENLKGTAR